MLPLIWQNEDSLEYCELTTQGAGHRFSGKIVLVLECQPAFVDYTLTCDNGWDFSRAVISQRYNGQAQQLTVTREMGKWRVDAQAADFPTSIHDIDLEISPASNTLPIRRLNLAVGEAADVHAAWVRFPSLKLEVLRQRYTRLDSNTYHYEAPDLDFTARLHVDDDGVMLRYDTLWQRISG